LSILYSDAHPGRAFGRNLGDNTYADFTGGYFAGLGTAHFAPAREVEDVFGSRFQVTSLVHTLETDHYSGRAVDAFWRIDCEKRE
jgi:hypothetical protein